MSFYEVFIFRSNGLKLNTPIISKPTKEINAPLFLSCICRNTAWSPTSSQRNVNHNTPNFRRGVVEHPPIRSSAFQPHAMLQFSPKCKWVLSRRAFHKLMMMIEGAQARTSFIWKYSCNEMMKWIERVFLLIENI